MKDTDKVTLTIGQIKKLIKEARCFKKDNKRKFKVKKQLNEYETYMGQDGRIYDDEGNVVDPRNSYVRNRRVDMYDNPDYDYYSDRPRKYRDWRYMPGPGDEETWNY